MIQNQLLCEDNITILSIDDNNNNLQTLEALIKEHFTYKVINAQNSYEALNILSRETIHLIICDIQMPEIDGFSFAKMLKINRKYQDIPLIFLTAFSDKEGYSTTQAYSIGAADYLTKPIDEVKLYNKLKGYLKPLEAELSLSNMRKTLLNSQIIGIMIVDEKQKILYSNTIAQEVIPHYYKHIASHAYIIGEENTPILPFELTCGEKFFLCFHTPLSDGTIKIEFEDITILKQQESIILLKNRFSAMGEMIGNIAHQWRQPLQEVSLALLNADIDLLESGSLDGEKSKVLLDDISKTVAYLSQTINDFRSFFSPIQIKEPFDIYASIDNVATFLTPSFSDKNIKISSVYPIPPLFIMGYKNELQQVIMNIMRNSYDSFLTHPNEDQTITLSYDLTETKISIIIEDNAGGIPIDVLPKIYDPYFTTKHQARGTGIGLYMSKTIIEEHFKGELTAENISNGARFVITLALPDETLTDTI